MPDLSLISSSILVWMRSWIFWTAIILGFFILTFGALFIRKRRKYVYPTLEITDLGDGKMGIKKSKAGWFKSKTWLFGLWDYAGEDVMRLRTGWLEKDRRILDASSEDFHDIFGKRGMVVQRKPDDPAVLVPVSKMRVKNDHLLNEIAPADFRDASNKLIDDAKNETISKLEKYLPYITFGALAVIFFVSLIIVVQFSKQSIVEAKSIVIETARATGTAIASSAP